MTGIEVNAALPIDSGSEKGASLWLVTFADLVAILVTFFIMLFSLTTVAPGGWDLGRYDTSAAIARGAGGLSGEAAKGEPTTPVRQVGPLARLDVRYLATLVREHADALRQNGEPTGGLDALRFDIEGGLLNMAVASDLVFEAESGTLTQAGAILARELAGILRYAANDTDIAIIAPVAQSPWRLAAMRADAFGAALAAAGFSRATGRHIRVEPDIEGAGEMRLIVHERGKTMARKG